MAKKKLIKPTPYWVEQQRGFEKPGKKPLPPALKGNDWRTRPVPEHQVQWLQGVRDTIKPEIWAESKRFVEKLKALKDAPEIG